MSIVQEFSRLQKEPGGAARRGRLSRARRAEQRAGYAFLTPWLIGLVVITLGPMLASLFLSFTDYNFLETPNWTGLQNYERLFDDSRFRTSLAVTFKYVIISVPLQLAAALLVAIVLDRGVRGLSFYRSVYYLPSLLGSSVAISILWRKVFGGDGLVNAVLGWVGIHGRSWVANPDTALDTLIVLHVWTFGAPMIIFLAGLRQIPQMYYEAAACDGAGRFTRFRSITLPLLTPIIFFNLVLQLIGSFQAFTQAYIISGGNGAPADSTLFYTLYLYMQGFGNFQMGYASAMAWVLALIIAAFTALNFLFSKYWVFYDD